ncbi:DUF6124 family protein [Pseudomonas antarctica]|uniref:DUF6124 family protein n=1 Tax=Pseudomonas antarctica TaxID=219572 RepID=UPI00387B4684
MRAGSLSLPCSLARYARTDLFTVDTETRFESALVHASSLLYCASATAQEAGSDWTGRRQTLVISVLHLVDMARALMDRAVACVEPG